jgi:arginine repressor
VWHETDKKPSSEPFLGTTGLNQVIDNPESVEVMSSITGDDLILLLNSLTFIIVKIQENGRSHLKY